MSHDSPTAAGVSATDLSDWLPIADAATLIGCSTRTVERLARAGKLEQRLRPQAGSPAVAVYNPDDVARMASDRRAAPPAFVLPAVQTPGNGNGHGRATNLTKRHFRNATSGDPLQQLCAFVLHALQSPPSPPVSEKVAETPRLFLTIPEAAARSGLSQANLRRRCQSGWPGAIKDGAWKIRRKDLEALQVAFGPGKYDDLASHVRGVAEAEGVVLLVVNGTRGTGLSAQLSVILTVILPDLLRDIARQIEEQGPDA